MRHITGVMVLLAALAAAGGQQPGGSARSLRITVQVPGDSDPLSGVVVTLLPLPNPAPSTLPLPETAEAWLTYLQNPAPANLPVVIAAKTTMTPTEARQKLAATHRQSLPAGAPIFEIGAGVSQPVLTKQVGPEYSDEARRNRVQGTVDAVAVVRDDGTIAAAEVIKTVGYGLDEKAVAAVKQWRFKPALKDGSPVPVYLTISVGFNMRGSSVVRTVVTDTKGIAVFNNLEAGRYAVRGAREGLVGIIAATVEPQAGTEAVLPLKRAATLSGVASDSNGMPLSDASITLGILLLQDGQRVFYSGSEVRTNTRGEYRLTSIGAGTYYLRVQPRQADLPITSIYYPGTADLSQAAALPVKSGQEVMGIDIAATK